MKNSISNFKKQNERRESRTRSMMGNSELPKYAGDWGDDVPKQKSAAELSDWAYFWKRWDHTIIFWGGLFLLFLSLAGPLEVLWKPRRNGTFFPKRIKPGRRFRGEKSAKRGIRRTETRFKK